MKTQFSEEPISTYIFVHVFEGYSINKVNFDKGVCTVYTCTFTEDSMSQKTCHCCTQDNQNMDCFYFECI